LVRLYQSKLQNAGIIDLGEFTTYEAGIATKAMKDGGAVSIDLFKIDEVMVDLYGNRLIAIEKAKQIQSKPVMIEITDIQHFYDIESSNVDFIYVKYFNDEAIKRIIMDNRGKKRLIIGGLILPQRLDVIGSYQFDYLHTTLFTNAARIYDIGVKVGI
jgi:nicotinate-nucleotide pyrophosphorylase